MNANKLCWVFFALVNAIHFLCGGLNGYFLVNLHQPTDPEMILFLLSLIYPLLECMLLSNYWFTLKECYIHSTNRILRSVYPNFVYRVCFETLLVVMYIFVLGVDRPEENLMLIISASLTTITTGANLPLSIAIRHQSNLEFGRIRQSDIEIGDVHAWVD